MRRKGIRVAPYSVSNDGLLLPTPLGSRSTLPPVLPAGSRSSEFLSWSDSALILQETVQENLALPKDFQLSQWHFYSTLAMCVLSFVLDDIRVIALPNSADTAVDTVLLALIVLYCAEISLKVVGVEGYCWSVGFWMDLWGAVGLGGDIAVLYQLVAGECKEVQYRALRLTVRSARLCSVAISCIRRLSVPEASERQRVGQQSAQSQSHSLSPVSPDPQLLVRSSSGDIFRTGEGTTKYENSDLGNHTHSKRQQTLALKSQRKMGTLRRILRHLQKPATQSLPTSRRGKSLQESRISKRVVRRTVELVAGVGIAIGLFAWSVRIQSGGVDDLRRSLKVIDSLNSTPRSLEMIEEYVSAYSDPSLPAVLTSLSISTPYFNWLNDLTPLRRAQCSVSLNTIRAEFTVYNSLRTLAILDLCETALLCILFFFVCMSVSSYIRNRILFPLERMTETMRQLWKSPIDLVNSEPNQTVVRARRCCESRKEFAESEVRLLENAFRKIGVMLGLVYGTAGGELITRIIEVDQTFTPLMNGKSVLAVFAFVRIGRFEEALEALRPNILSYINLISSFVHHSCEHYLGSVNKNLGDSYLLVWKFPVEDGMIVQSHPTTNPYSQTVRSTAGLALLCAVKAVHKVTTSGQLAAYRNQIKKVIWPKFITFGFHIGWAYEGPIGSAFKIDASYLSPSVNVAARIESAARQYDVHILMSFDMYLRVDDEVKSYLRHIDTVRLKGVNDDMQLFTLDLCCSPISRFLIIPNKFRTHTKRNKLKHLLEGGQVTISQLFFSSHTLARMRQQYPKAFFRCYAAALSLYFAGQWQTAYELFARECLPLAGFDGPTKAIMEAMEKRAKMPPRDWRGVRELLCK